MLEESMLIKYSRSSVGNGGLLETIEDLQVTYRLYNPFGFLMLFDTSNNLAKLRIPERAVASRSSIKTQSLQLLHKKKTMELDSQALLLVKLGLKER